MSDKNYSVKYSIDNDGCIKGVEFRFRDSKLFSVRHETGQPIVHRDAKTNELAAVFLVCPITFEDWSRMIEIESSIQRLSISDIDFLQNCVPNQFMQGDWS